MCTRGKISACRFGYPVARESQWYSTRVSGTTFAVIQELDEQISSTSERRCIMRVLIGLALVVLLLAVVGWITFSHNGARTSINLETSQIKHDTSEMVDSGKTLLENAKTATTDQNRPNDNGARPGTTQPMN